jgi:glycosyltransferase involved in cell wall biosynthesis
MKRQRVLFFVSSLAGGGAERVMVDLLRNIDRNTFQPLLVLLHQFEDSPYRQHLPEDIRVIVVARKKDSVSAKLKQLLAFFKVVRREKPDVILSMLTHNNIMSLLSGLLFGIRVIACEHNTLSEVMKTEEGQSMLGMPVAPMVKVLYRFAENIITVSEGIKSDLISAIGISPHRIKTIYNPIDLNRVNSLMHAPPGHPFFAEQKPVVVAMGRMTAQKRFDILLNAFSRVILSTDARLIILGEGPERTRLENMVKDLGIEEKVSLAGFQRNPYALLAHADVFVLSSQYEGLPMAILEAMACGLPVISTDCRSGPTEILEDGQCGILVPVNDEAALAEAMTELLKDKKQREELSERGKERVRDFSVGKIVRQYEEIICKEAVSHRETSS